jgi:hypothetical protein
MGRPTVSLAEAELGKLQYDHQFSRFYSAPRTPSGGRRVELRVIRIPPCRRRESQRDELSFLLINQDLGGFWEFRRLSIP